MNFYLQLSSDLRYIMRITLSQLIVCIVLTGVSYADATNAQGVLNNTVKLNQTTTSLNNVLRKIEKAANVKFVYSKSIINTDQLVSISANEEKLSVVLKDLLKTRGIAYEVIDQQIVLTPLKQSIAVNTETSQVEKADITITGNVTDQKGEPLIGVSVKVKGSTSGTATNTSGNFSINIPGSISNPVLVFSYLGYSSQEIAVTGRTTINVQLVENVKALQEVVVVGYGTQKKGTVSQAITSVDMENLRDVPVTNVTQALQGRVPGLVSTPNSFRPGSPSTIRLRGSRSLTAGNDPLYVVDGIPINYSIDDINPLDIESIDVLKDAAATAIYGSRGANGVIQITTKKGKAGKLSVEYNGNASADNIVRKLEVYNGSEFAQFRRDAFIGSGVYNPSANANNANKRYFPDPESDFAIFTSGDNMLWDNVKNAYEWVDLDITSTPKRFVAKTRPTTAEEKAVMANLGYPVLNEVAIYDPSKITTYNWGDEALRTGITQNHNISVSGGSDKFRSSFGGGYYKQTGIVKSQDFTRFTLSNNNNFRPREFLSFGTNITYSNAIRNAGSDLYGAANGQFPLAHPYDSNGNLIFNPGRDDLVFNPLNDVNTVLDEFRINRFLGNAFGQVNLLKGLSYRIAIGVDLNSTRRGRFTGTLSSVRRGTAAPDASYNISTGFVWTLQNQLNYNTTIGSKHSLGATVVQELRKRRDEINNSSATDLTYESQKWYALQNNAKSSFVVDGNFLQDQLASHIGRLNYSFDNKYIFEVGVRHDASSVLSPENNSQVFPFSSLAWRMDQEAFIKNLIFIDQLKLRVGFGAVGNSGIDPYQTGPILNTTYYNFGDNVAVGYTPLRLGSNVAWERTVTKNLGIDYGFKKGVFTGSIDIYESNTNNIQNQELPAAGGVQFHLVNIGNVRNRGLEVALSTVNIDKSTKKGGFKWISDFTFATNKEEITELNSRGADQIAQQWFYGQPIRTYWDFKGQGIYQYADTLAGGILKDYFWKKNPSNKSASSPFMPGKIRVQDINGDAVINDLDRVQLGSPNPKWTGSLNNTFSFNGFDLSSFIYISKGALVRDFRPGLVGRYPGPKVDYWTPTNPSNSYQQPVRESDIPQYWQALSFRDGSFVRVRSILLAYHVPTSLINKWGVNNLTVSVNAVNPFLFSNYKRYDPESVPYNSSYPPGNTGNPAPNSYSSRSFVFGLRMGL